MYAALLTLHIILCLVIIVTVLLQSGKGAGISGIFGGGGSDALFSAPSGSSFIRKFTFGLMAAFFLTSVLLTYLIATRGQRTVTRGAFAPGAMSMPMELPSETLPPAPPSAE